MSAEKFYIILNKYSIENTKCYRRFYRTGRTRRPRLAGGLGSPDVRSDAGVLRLRSESYPVARVRGQVEQVVRSQVPRLVGQFRLLGAT
jgi:hypothetical protein